VLTVSKSYHYLKSSICFLCLIVCHNQYAQTDLLFDAQKLCNEKKFEQAIPLIEKVITNPETKNDPASWHIRSYAYIQTYKLAGPANTAKINLLDTAMSSALISIKLDSANGYSENNKAFIKNGALYYYKISTVLLQDSLNNVKSEKYYNNYKKYTTIINPTFDFKQKDIEYYNATGGFFADLYMKHNFNQKYGDIAKFALLKVLDIDNKNISANINLGVLYYNQGATLMQMMDYDVDLAQLDVIQENAKKLFKQSLPFMIKVYELDPKAERALESLQGIYSALLDDAKANEFKQKKEALNKQK
jgi:tetratricopeptide (TPR) repeat protein